MSINRYIKLQTVVSSYNRIMLSKERNVLLICIIKWMILDMDFKSIMLNKKMPQSTGCMIYLFEILEKSSLIYSHRRQISSWIVVVVGVVENWLWALENFFGGGNILHLDGNSDCIGIHICLNSNYKLIASAFIICKLYFNKVNRVGRGYHGFCILPFQLNLE